MKALEVDNRRHPNPNLKRDIVRLKKRKPRLTQKAIAEQLECSQNTVSLALKEARGGS